MHKISTRRQTISADSQMHTGGRRTSIRSAIDSDLAGSRILVFDKVLPGRPERQDTCIVEQKFKVRMTYDAAMKSSKQLTYVQAVSHIVSAELQGWLRTLRSRVPARCHSSPNSPPPRMLATARMAPYFCIHVRIAGLKNGLMDMVKPP